MNMKIIFAWYDLWIGLFADTKKGVIYICPVPTVVIVINTIPKGYSIEKISTCWNSDKPKPAYIAYKHFEFDEEPFQLGTFKNWYSAYIAIIKSKNLKVFES